MFTINQKLAFSERSFFNQCALVQFYGAIFAMLRLINALLIVYLSWSPLFKSVCKWDGGGLEEEGKWRGVEVFPCFCFLQ